MLVGEKGFEIKEKEVIKILENIEEQKTAHQPSGPLVKSNTEQQSVTEPEIKRDEESPEELEQSPESEIPASAEPEKQNLSPHDTGDSFELQVDRIEGRR